MPELAAFVALGNDNVVGVHGAASALGGAVPEERGGIAEDAGDRVGAGSQGLPAGSRPAFGRAPARAHAWQVAGRKRRSLPVADIFHSRSERW